MNDKGKYFITTAIAYTSRIPHIGNTYEAVLTDSIARFRRMEGYDVYFLTGTDEHGQKIEEQAKKCGQTPQEHVDAIAGEIRRIWDFMNVSYDRFIRTTDPKHMDIVAKIFKKLYDKGDIYKGYYEGFYCKPCESFFTQTQIDEGKCPECGAKVERTKEEAYFLKLSKYAPALEKYIEDNPDFIQPASRKNEMINNFIKPGLSDLCVSRSSFKWGVPVSFDEKHVIYVWIDALSNYITALGYNPEGESDELYKRYWPADVHLIGKDILRFHTIYWPIMLMALEIPLPKQVFGHPWMLFGEDKMSKSKGNVVYAQELVERFGVDAVRYYMLREMPFASDGTFTYELLISRINSDLANILGNLVSRTVAMAGKYFGGAVPAPSKDEGEFDADLKSTALSAVEKTVGAMKNLRVADAIDEIFTLLRRTNKYIDETTPWILAKKGENERLGTVIYNLIESIRIASVLLTPFLPETGAKIQRMTGAQNVSLDSTLSFGAFVPGSMTVPGEPLFMRIDEKAALTEIAEQKSEQKPAEAAAECDGEKVGIIDISDFEKVKLRVAEVTACEPIPKAKKLLKLTVSLGDETRTVVSGIAEWYKPEELTGRRVIIVSNLKPALLRGVESCGMILAADNGPNDVRVIFADGIEPGSAVR